MLFNHNILIINTLAIGGGYFVRFTHIGYA